MGTKFTSLEEKRGVDPSMKALRDYWGKTPALNHKRKIQEKYSKRKSPGKGHTSRYEVDDEDDDGEPKGT